MRRRQAPPRHGADFYLGGEIGLLSSSVNETSVKLGYKGTYHEMSAKHLARYVTEFAGRHNARGTGHPPGLGGPIGAGCRATPVAVRRSDRPAMPNKERITEDYVRDHFKNDPLFVLSNLKNRKHLLPKQKQCLAQPSRTF